MRVIAIGKRSFVAGFRLAGIPGIEVKTAEEALEKVRKMVQSKEVGLIIVGDDVARPVRRKLTDIKAKQPIPLIYELPAPGSPQEKIEYRTLLRLILKMA
ncbi:MAG: V-type ATP synthase subunit F [Nitrososphaerales archaeon]